MPRQKIHSRICVVCGGPTKRADAKKCRACFDAGRNLDSRCIDCGTRIEGNSRTKQRQRCWPCWVAFRPTTRPTNCSIDGCSKPYYSKGLCQSHYQVGRRTGFRDVRRFDRESHYQVGQQPCAVCGYSRMKSEVHRIVPGGSYLVGNMVALCSRCHDEVERGLTACPPAWQP